MRNVKKIIFFVCLLLISNSVVNAKEITMTANDYKVADEVIYLGSQQVEVDMLIKTSNETPKNVSNTSKGTINMSICQQDGVKKALKFIGILLVVAKILVPIILIVFGVMDYSKAMIASDADAISKATKSLIFRVVAGVIIFVLPTIVNFIFSTVVKNKANFNQCRACIFERKC